MGPVEETCRTRQRAAAADRCYDELKREGRVRDGVRHCCHAGVARVMPRVMKEDGPGNIMMHTSLAGRGDAVAANVFKRGVPESARLIGARCQRLDTSREIGGNRRRQDRLTLGRLSVRAGADRILKTLAAERRVSTAALPYPLPGKRTGLGLDATSPA